MRLSYTILAVCVINLFDHTPLYSQTSDLIFSQCADTVTRLCVQDDGVRLPASNQVYLGVGHPDATRGSVHVTRSTTVSGGCGSVLNYKVELLAEDSTSFIPFKPWTDVTLDTAGEATLIFDTEFSSDSVIRQAGMAYSSKCDSNYTIIWTVIDSCGMGVSCVEELHLYDCSAPLPGPPGGLYVGVIPAGCALRIYARDYDTGSIDDQSSSDSVTFSFREDLYQPDSLVICPSAFGVELALSVWIADEGADINCDGQIEWKEHNLVIDTVSIVFTDNGGCDCWEEVGSNLSGDVTTVPADGIKGVEITLYSPGHVFPTYITDENGTYIFRNVVHPMELQVIPYKNDFHKNGVSSLDLIKIQKHLLGKEIIEDPYLLIAADANSSQNLSAIDLIELRKLILGIYTALPATNSWQFARKDYVFQDPANPWEDIAWQMNEIQTITTTAFEDHYDLDFYGIKVGDLNYTANPYAATSLLPRSIPSIAWETTDQHVKQGQSILVPLSLSAAASVTGFQFTLEFPEFEFVGLHPGVIALSEDDYALFEDRLTMSWFDEKNVDIDAQQPLFFIEFKAKQTLSLSNSLTISSAVTEAEMYVDHDQIVQPYLQIENDQDQPSLIRVSCSPNPWKDQTEISIHLATAEFVSMSVYSIEGKRIWYSTMAMTKGSHQIQFRASDVPAYGPMILQVSTSEGVITQRMIKME